EPQDHGPEQRHRLDLAATPHQAAELRQEVQLPRRDQAGQLPADSDRLSSGHGVSSFSESLDNPMRTEDVALFLPPSSSIRSTALTEHRCSRLRTYQARELERKLGFKLFAQGEMFADGGEVTVDGKLLSHYRFGRRASIKNSGIALAIMFGVLFIIVLCREAAALVAK